MGILLPGIELLLNKMYLQERTVDSDPLDLSIGLAPSLELLRRYKKSGILQASVAHIPGMREEGLVRLHLVNGEVVACEVIRRDGQAYSIPKER
jgi:hypothetical protein